MRSPSHWLVVLGASSIALACSAETASVKTEAAPTEHERKVEDTGSPAEETGDETKPDATPPATGPDPVVFVHGVKGSSANFKVMMDRLVADGWPITRLWALDYSDPQWGCNVDNAATLKTFVEKVLSDTKASRVDIVAHSMGTLSSRRFMKVLGGAALVNTYVTLGGMHHGLGSACLNPLPVCVWQELCGTKPYLTELNTAPLTPGPSRWVSIFSHADQTVPADSSKLDGAENIPFDGVDHAGANGLLEQPEVYAQVKRVLEYPPAP